MSVRLTLVSTPSIAHLVVMNKLFIKIKKDAPNGTSFLLLLSIGCFFGAWLWPFRPMPIHGFHQETLAFFAATLLLAYGVLNYLYIPRPALAFIALAFIPLLQGVFGVIIFAGNAWLSFVYIFIFALMIACGYNLTNEHNRQIFHSLFAGILIVASVLSTWIALRQYLHLASSDFEINLHRHRPYANLAQPNNLATLLGMGLAAALYFYETSKLGRLAAGVLTAFLILGIALTQSRTPWVTSLAVLAFVILKKRQITLKLSITVLFTWIVFYAALVVTLPSLYQWLGFQGASLAGRAAALERWPLWSQMWYAVIEGPFWGYGWNQTGAAQMSVTLDKPLFMMTSYSHNIVLDLWLWIGLVPGTLLVLCLSAWLMRLAYIARNKESIFALIGCGFILVHSLLEFPFAYAYFLFPLGLLLGVAQSESKQSLFAAPKALLICVLVGLGLFVKLVISDYFIVAEHYQEQKMKAAKVIGFESKKALSDIVLLTQYRQLYWFKGLEIGNRYSDDELGEMQKAVQVYPHLANLYKISLIMFKNNKNKQSQTYIKILCNMHRTHNCSEAILQYQDYTGQNLEL